MRELTRRQREVVELVRRGHSNKEIAASLGVSEQCIKAHVSRLLALAGATNRVGLIEAIRAVDPTFLGALPNGALRGQDAYVAPASPPDSPGAGVEETVWRATSQLEVLLASLEQQEAAMCRSDCLPRLRQYVNGVQAIARVLAHAPSATTVADELTQSQIGGVKRPS